MPEGEVKFKPQEAGILPEKFQDLHKSSEVKRAVQESRRRGEKVPNQPQETVSRYLGSLLNRHGLLGGDVGNGNAHKLGKKIQQNLPKS